MVKLKKPNFKVKLKPIHKQIIIGSLIAITSSGITAGYIKETLPVDDTTTVVSMTDKDYSIKDVYNQTKLSTETQDVLRQFVVTKAIFSLYEDKITQKEIDDQVAAEKEQIPNFQQVLISNNLTEEQYIENIKKQLVINYGLRDNIDVTDKEIEETWVNFYPSITTNIAVFESEEDATQFSNHATTTNFESLAASSNVVGGEAMEVTYDSTNSPLPANVAEIIHTLEIDNVSQPIKGIDESTDSTYYYVINVLSKEEKPESIDEMKKEITELTKTNKLLNEEHMITAISSILEKANISIKDPDLKDLLSDYLNK